MNRLALATLVAVILGCPRGDKSSAAIDTIARDTTPMDLNQTQAALPPPAPDTFTPPKLPTAEESRGSYPPAPAELMAAVEREQAFTNFCYREFGLKSDPQLRGGVAMIVTVARRGVTAARVGADNWTSASGKAVNRCLNERASDAWKVTPGDVRPGTYQVNLRFSGAS